MAYPKRLLSMSLTPHHNAPFVRARVANKQARSEISQCPDRKVVGAGLTQSQELRFRSPWEGIKEDFRRIYEKGQIQLGWPKKVRRIFENLARKNTVGVFGVALGDEGKGRIVDNYIETLLKTPEVRTVWAVRFNGGNNAGHTLIDRNGQKLAVHLVPSAILYRQAKGIMDRGMVIHPEDLKTEIEYLEERIGKLDGRLFLSEEAILCTDLERAEEVLNGVICGEAKGGTGRGISPAYAHHYDRQGSEIYDFLGRDWKEKLSRQYDSYQKKFSAFGMKLFQTVVPDFKTAKQKGKAQTRPLGSKREFLANLESTREWLIAKGIVTNTFLLHKKIAQDLTCGILFEGAQGMGLDAWLGTRPDVTSSNTRASGVEEGTAYWRPHDIQERIGVFKITYTSSVGARIMPTQITLPKNINDLPSNCSKEQSWAKFVVEEAQEFGTTTGRRRDVCFLDLPFLIYNARMSGVEVLTGTHLDIALEKKPIKICTHYTDSGGDFVAYQPGLKYQEKITPSYLELPGWDGKACKGMKSFKDLPAAALKFLAFIQARTGYPIVAATTGPARKDFLKF